MAVDFSTIGKTQSYINQATAEATSTNNTTLDQEDFLKLLTTQLAQQDPTAPYDNNQMITTMSQLSVVENLTTINGNMQGIIDAVTSSSALSASTLVGRSVLVDTNQGFFDGQNGITCQIDAGSGADNIKVVVKDSNGSVVSEYESSAGSGDMQFTWDGVKNIEYNEDGSISNVEFYDPGKYTIEVTGTVDGATKSLPTKTYATVGSVTLGTTMDTTMLNLIGYGDVPLSDVEEVSL